jgi:feruloyl esterase
LQDVKQDRLKRLFGAISLAGIGASGIVAAQPQASVGLTACQALASLGGPNVTVTLAESIAAGGFAPPGGRVGPSAGVFEMLPSFCRVAATLTPSSDSDIKIEVWLPEEGWNGKFQAVGNFGWSGSIGYAGLAAALQRGYATASTDTGHSGGSGAFALGHPEKLIDFGYRAVHEMTVQAKAVIEAFYDDRAAFSYWVGCSSGGRQGLKEAQRFPDDYDGIVAGAPANYWTHKSVQQLGVGHATLIDPASYIQPEKYGLIQRAVLTSCDTLDGVEDGVIEDPRRCEFDPGVLECAAPDPVVAGDPADAAEKGGTADGDPPECLTPAQVEAARRIYAPATNPRTGEEIFPGLEPGSENGWAGLAAGPEPATAASDYYKFVVFEDPDWDFRTLDFDEDVALADATDNGLINANDPDIRPFVDRGSKLLMWHGWSDGVVAPRNTIAYLERVQSVVGDDTSESVRLFMAPGVGHCRGGAGPDTFDLLTTLEQWVEEGAAPDRIVASRIEGGDVVRTRPLCPYPQVARYSGSGSTDEESSFVCR